MEFLRHKSFDRFIKFEKGKVTNRIAIIRKRHDASKSLSFETVRVINSCVWNIKSESEPNEYTINQISEECGENCGMRCKECNICVHLYSCSCPDSILLHTICKHVHLVARYRQQDELPSVKDTLDDVLMEEIATQKQSGSCESVQNRITVLLNETSSLVQSSDSYKQLRITETKLIAIKGNLIVPAMEVSSTLPFIHEPPNKNVEKQRSFQSFKKSKVTRYNLETLPRVFTRKFR